MTGFKIIELRNSDSKVYLQNNIVKEISLRRIRNITVEAVK